MVVLYICKVELLQEWLLALQSAATAISAVEAGSDYDEIKAAAAIQEAFCGHAVYKDQASFGEVGMATRAKEVLMGMMKVVTEERVRYEGLLTAARAAQSMAASLLLSRSMDSVGSVEAHGEQRLHIYEIKDEMEEEGWEVDEELNMFEVEDWQVV